MGVGTPQGYGGVDHLEEHLSGCMFTTGLWGVDHLEEHLSGCRYTTGLWGCRPLGRAP